MSHILMHRWRFFLSPPVHIYTREYDQVRSPPRGGMLQENDVYEKQPEIIMPPHAFVPGFSPRHPPNLFNDIKSSVRPGMPVKQLQSTKAFLAGRLYFEGGFFWECHEVLEVIWRQTKDPSPERDLVLALIQLANARLKVLMLQPSAALRLCDMVETHLARCPEDRAILGVQVGEMLSYLSEARLIARAAILSPY